MTASESREAAIRSFDRFLSHLATIPDPRRAEGKLYQLPHVLLFAILAIVTGANSYRGIRTFIKTHRRRLNKAFAIGWKRPPAHTAIRYILQGLNPADVETAFREHAADLNDGAMPASMRIVALDGKALKGSFDAFNDDKARQILSAFAADTALVLAHIEIDEKSNEIPAVQKLLEELDVAGHIVTLDAMHCQKNFRSGRRGAGALDRSIEGQPTDPVWQRRDCLQKVQAAVQRSDNRSQKTKPSRNPNRGGIRRPAGSRRNRMAALCCRHRRGRTEGPDVPTGHRAVEVFVRKLFLPLQPPRPRRHRCRGHPRTLGNRKQAALHPRRHAARRCLAHPPQPGHLRQNPQLRLQHLTLQSI